MLSIAELRAMNANPVYRRRTEAALVETQRFIDRETARGAHNRPADMQDALDKAISHRAKLLAVLEN